MKRQPDQNLRCTDEEHLPHNTTQIQPLPIRVNTVVASQNAIQAGTTAFNDSDKMLSKDTKWYASFIHFGAFACVFNLGGILCLYLAWDMKQIVALLVPSFPNSDIFAWLPLYVLEYLIVFVLLTLLINDMRRTQAKGSFFAQLAYWSTALVHFLLLLLAGTRYYLNVWLSLVALGGSYAIYVLLAISYRIFGRDGFLANCSDMFRPIRSVLNSVATS